MKLNYFRGLIALSVIIATASWCAVSHIRSKEPKEAEQLFDSVRVGSAIVTIQSLLENPRVVESSVRYWTPVGIDESDPRVYSTQWGRFRRSDPRSFSIGNLTNKFTGSINITIHRTFMDDLSCEFVYTDGILREKSFGYSPF